MLPVSEIRSVRTAVEASVWFAAARTNDRFLRRVAARPYGGSDR